MNIGHGYNPSEYKLTPTEEDKLKDKYNIKVGYVGNLSIKYIDWALIVQLIDRNRDIGFYFCGPIGKSNLSAKSNTNKNFDILLKRKNFIYLGEIASHKIPAYLSYLDILILVYKDRDFTKQLANPHKILEYLGSGRVIVSSWIEEYKNKKGLIEMSQFNSRIPDKFKYVIDNLAYLNSKEKQNERIGIAKKNSYDQKIKEINRLLNSIL